MLGVMFSYICADTQTLVPNNFNGLTISHTNKSVLPHIKQHAVALRVVACAMCANA